MSAIVAAVTLAKVSALEAHPVAVAILLETAGLATVAPLVRRSLILRV